MRIILLIKRIRIEKDTRAEWDDVDANEIRMSQTFFVREEEKRILFTVCVFPADVREGGDMRLESLDNQILSLSFFSPVTCVILPAAAGGIRRGCMFDFWFRREKVHPAKKL
jgi:hypothetical protein